MKKIYSSLFFICFSFCLFSQSDFKVIVEGLKASDSATVSIQKGSESKFSKIVKNSNDKAVEITFSGDYALSDGKWALSIDATGYTYPTSKIIVIPTDLSATITLTAMINDGKFKYKWKDDDSAAGHNTQSYYSEPTSIKVLDKTVKVPNDYSSIFLRNRYGVILSNEIESWTKEDSYRLFKTFSNLPYDPYGKVDFSNGDNIRGVFKLTKDDQYRDLTITQDGSLKNVTISQRAFVYASAQIVTIDGIKGKFYSKRLYHALVNYLTDFGNDENEVSKIADASFGVKFMKSNQETEDLMSEDSSNFQSFTSVEKIEILSMFEELPEGFHKQNGLKYLVRRINGQDNPTYIGVPAIAWTGLKTIEFMSKAFSGGSLNYSRRLILHEKAHFLWAYTFDKTLKDDWAEIGGWFKDPTTASGWSTYNTTESVSAYAHLKNPNEDMAESIAFYLTNPDKLLNVSVKKYEFIRDRVMHGTRYVAQIREDLTFTVYNLFPDYTFPGKVIGVEIEVTGEPDKEKVVKFTAALNSENYPYDAAKQGYARFISSIGTIHDIGLHTQNGEIVDSVLVGTSVWNKYEKAGYWTLQFFRTWDEDGNQRHENTSTIGVKLFTNNIDEDILPPVWNHDLELEVVKGKFDFSNNTTKPNEDGIEMQAIKITSSVYDNKKMGRMNYRIINPSIDSATGDKLESGDFIFERQSSSGPTIDVGREYANEYASNKYFENYLAVPEFFPSGYYAISMIDMSDYARNGADVFFVKDTTDFIIPDARKLTLYKDVRDSIYVKTEYPDYRRPEIDINNITIIAEPTKPSAPDGETRVDVTLIARDVSDFEGKEAGVSKVSFTFRDPLGNDHGYQTGNSTMNHPELDKTRKKSGYDGISEWKAYDFNFTLPKGSPPGKWGMLEAYVTDKAGNTRKYSFVEYVRFDVIESDIKLTSPLKIEIIDKHINAKNVDSITAKMSCTPCKDLNYVYTIYSRMGGGGTVVRGEGKFSNDSIIVNNIKSAGVLDGLVNLTVQVTDSTSALVATKSAQYTKDVVYPKAYYSKFNIQDDGTNNIDELTIDITVEKSDVGGTYSYGISNTTAKSGIPIDDEIIKWSGVNSSNEIKYFTGILDSISKFEMDGTKVTFNIKNLDLTHLKNGYFKTSLKISDQVKNEGDEYVYYYFLKDGNIKKIGVTIIDSDDDEIGDELDNCPTTANTDQTDLDEDGTGDVCDDDKDGDTILNDVDNCPNTANADQADMDEDGIGDVCDDDKDGDTILNDSDNCPSTANTDQADIDRDGIGDVCDNDKDGDTILNDSDNCPSNANTDQADFDDDKIGDVCDSDIDGDGVLNEDDDCDDTPKDSKINTKGCVVFELPTTNNKVSVNSSTCIGASDGSIGLSIEDASFDYSITVTGKEDPITITGDDKTASVTGLAGGTYSVCFAVTGQADYEQCFEVVIGEPKALSAFIDVDNDKRTTSIQLAGSKSYNIDVNGQRFEVKGDRFNTTLPTGLSIIKISTGLDCQGMIEKEVFISEDIHYYPNPTDDDVSVHVSGEDTRVLVSVFSEKGSLIYSKEQQIQDFSRKTNIDLSRQITGTYIVVMESKTVRKTFKIVKR